MTTFTALLDTLEACLDDPGNALWSRTDELIPFVKEALNIFPILRSLVDDHANGLSVVTTVELPTGFREVIAVEYPISQSPPQYIQRKSRFAHDFYTGAYAYDIDATYSAVGYSLYLSFDLPAAAHIKTYYLATHASNLADDSTAVVTVNQEHEAIIIAYAMYKAFLNRYAHFNAMGVPLVDLMQQLREAAKMTMDHYMYLLANTGKQLETARIPGHVQVDKYDRAY